MNSWLKGPDPGYHPFKAITSWVVALLFFSLPMNTNAQKTIKHIAVSLTSDQAEYTLGQPVMLTFWVKNNHKKAVSFCQYMTPFEGFNGSILKVKDESGNLVKYHGIMKKRGEAGPDDYITLEPGENKSMKFDLMAAYPLPAKGTYTVQFIGNKYMNKLEDSNEIEIYLR